MTSSTFCLAKASQFFSAGERDASFCSKSKSQGEWSNEQEVPTMTRSEPSTAMTLPKVFNELSRSFFQMFLPSTNPKDRFSVGGRAFRIESNCSGARTKSTWSVDTGRLLASDRLSPKASKYVVKRIFRPRFSAENRS